MTTPTPGASRPPVIFDRSFLTDAADVTSITFVRHGEQYIPDPRGGPFGDTIDPALSARGARQAHRVGLRFSTQRVDVVYASPLRRALDTGREIARHHRLEPIVIHDLREVEIFRDIPADQPAREFLGIDLLMGVRERMFSEKKWDVYPFSESSHDFLKRTVNAVEAIIAANDSRRVVVACHGGVINAYIGHILGIDYDMFFRPAHTAVNVVYAARGGVRALQSLNDVHHLLDGDAPLVSH